jgi:hypothetical protein
MAKKADPVDLSSWSDDEVVEKGVVPTPIQQHVPIDLTYDTENPFINAYNDNIKKFRDMITGQWSECTRDKKNLDIQAPTTSDEVCVPLDLPSR